MGAVVSSLVRALGPGHARHAPTAGGLVRMSGPARLCATVIDALKRVELPGESLPPLDVTVTRDSRAADGLVDGRLLWSTALPPHAPASTLLGQIVGTLTTMLTRLLFVHAGVVALGGRAMVVVGQSGTGKTSTVAALVRRGAGYLSDEVALLDPWAGTAVPFVLPMAMKSWTRRAAGTLPAGRRVARENETELWLPDDIGEIAPVGTFVLLRDEEAGSALTPISPAQMLLAISDHASSFKQQHRVREAFSGFVRLVRNARCAALNSRCPAAHAGLLAAFAEQSP